MRDFGIWEYCLPTKIIFGENQLEKVGIETKRFGKKAFLVTGKASMKKSGVTDQVLKIIGKEGIEVVLYDAVESNPSTDTIDCGTGIARSKHCDVIVALGGGSAIDTAKAIAVVAKYGSKVWDYVGKNIPGEALPLIAIPTTAGTGSEVTPWSVFTNNDLRWKAGIGSVDTIPRVAIIDPTLMALMPKELVASSGMDALTHAIEAYTSSITNFMDEHLALQSIGLACRYLIRAVKDRKDMEAISGMALSSTFGGMALTHAGVGTAHAMGMTIGGFFNTNHGVTVGLLLPHVVEYNLPHRIEKYACIAEILGRENHSIGKNCDKLPDMLGLLLSEIGIPIRMREIGVKEDTIPEMIEDTMTHQKDDLQTNPVMPTRNDVEQLYRKAF